MINVSIKIHCKSIVAGLRDGEYELPDGATAEDALEAARREAGIELSDGAKNSIVFMVNGRPIGAGTLLSDGNKIRVLQKILGG